MLNFLLKLIIAIAFLIGLIFFIRYSMKMLSGFDKFFTKKYKRISKGLRWGVRLPTKAGEIMEFYFYVILGKKNYMNYASWPVKICLIISMFLFLAVLSSRSFVMQYYTFGLVGTEGINPYLSGGSILWFLHLVTFAYAVLLTLVAFDSIKMMGYYAPIRLVYFCIVMIAAVTASMLSFSLLITLSVFYLIYRIIMLFFGNRNRNKGERKPSFFAKQYATFIEVHNTFDHPDIVNEEPDKTDDPGDKKYYDNDIPKVFGDSQI